MKERYNCNELKTTVNFLPTRINFCCTTAEGLGVEYATIDDLEKINTAKENYVKLMNNGTCPKECVGCNKIEKITDKETNPDKTEAKNEDYLIDRIIINHFKQCDCRCIYCAQKDIWGDECTQNYEALPLIKKLYAQKKISDKVHIEFQGGNVSLLKEFDDLTKEFLKHGCEKITIFTNGIKYLPIVEEAAQKTNVEILISLDAGTARTFKIIKQVDRFKSVLNNIKKFQSIPNVKVCIKYIIIPDVNDYKEEFDALYNTILELEIVKFLILDIDYRALFNNSDDEYYMPLKYIPLIQSLMKNLKAHGISCNINGNSEKYYLEALKEAGQQ